MNIRSFFHLPDIVCGSCWVQFVPEEVSLHLCSTDISVSSQRLLCKAFPFRGRLVRVEPLEHLHQLPVGAVAEEVLHVHSAGTDQCCVQPVGAESDWN